MNEQYSIAGKVAVISGAAGVLGGSLARHFAAQGAVVAALVHREEQIPEVIEELNSAGKGGHCAYACNVLDTASLSSVAEDIVRRYSHVDILINVAGGNVAGANVMPDRNFWDMRLEDWDKVLALNLNGTVYPGYGAAKEGVSNFTRWLAAEMAIKYGEKIRVNALAPGFFIGKQNRAALLNEDGSLTERSNKVIAKTPMRRFGDIDELNGAAQFLCSDAASFITGVILPVDGGFSSFSGV